MGGGVTGTSGRLMVTTSEMGVGAAGRTAPTGTTAVVDALAPAAAMECDAPARKVRTLPGVASTAAARLAGDARSSSNHATEPATVGGFRIGQNVEHAKFGLGVIVSAEGRGSEARVQVNFGAHGMKWLAPEYAKLTPC